MRQLHEVVEPVEVAGELGDDQPTLGVVRHVTDAFEDLVFTVREAFGFGVCAVSKDGPYPVATEVGEGLHIQDRLVQRHLIDLPVAREDVSADRRIQRDGPRVGDRMVDVDKFDLKRPDLEHFVRRDREHVHLVVQVVLLELRLHHLEGEFAGVQRHVDFLEEVRKRADVVLVAVGQQHAIEPVEIVHDVRPVRQDVVDAVGFGLREGVPAVDHQHGAVALHEGTVHADFIEATQRDEPQIVVVVRATCDFVFIFTHATVLRVGVTSDSLRKSPSTPWGRPAVVWK
jgi:hypothetical protein